MHPTGFKEVKLLDFEVKGILPLEFQAAGGDSVRGGWRSDLFEESTGVLGLVVGSGLNRHIPGWRYLDVIPGGVSTGGLCGRGLNVEL